MTTLTAEQTQAIRERLATHDLTHGVGAEEAACMSEVVGKWIIGMQGAMPLDRVNAARWRDLLPLAVGTGRQHEQERLDIIMDWMWGTVLPQVQPMADQHGFGVEWRSMCNQRTLRAEAATEAARAAAKWADAGAAADAAMWAAEAADAAKRAAMQAMWAMWATAAVNPPNFFDAVDPEGLLERLIRVGGAK